MPRRPPVPSRVIDIERLEHESRPWFLAGILVGAVCFFLAELLYPSLSSTPLTAPTSIPASPFVVHLIVRPPGEDLSDESTGPADNITLRPDATPALPGASPTYKRPVILDGYTADDLPEAATETMQAVQEQQQQQITGLAPGLPDSLRDPFHVFTNLRQPSDSPGLRDLLLAFDEIDALGQYKGFVIRDPSDRENIRGFFHIPQYLDDFGRAGGYNLQNALLGLSEAFNYYTGMRMIVDSPKRITAADLQTYPVIYIINNSSNCVDTSIQEAQYFKHYLTHGGFAIIENGNPWDEWTPAKATLLNLLVKTFGDSISMKPIPRDHPLFHCFFDLQMQLPIGAENWTPPPIDLGNIPDWGKLLRYKDLEKLRDYVNRTEASLWGIWHGDRLVAIYSDKGYGHFWQDGIITNQGRDFYSQSGEKYNFNPQLKLGVNMLVFALLQEGGLARRLTEY